MMFNENNDFDKMMEKRNKFYERMENDFDFRMEQVDKKLFTVNGLAGFKKFMRYQASVIEHNRQGEYVDTYQIGLLGEIRKY